jgi:hypothetical protein
VPTPPLESLRQSLEEERRKTLSFNRALDHIGFAPSKLDWASLRALHERDAQAAHLLYGIERGHITSTTSSDHRRETEILCEDAERLRSKVRTALPKPFQKRLALALQVANSTITIDDIYADIRAAP